MGRGAWIIAIVAATACGSAPTQSLVGPMDGGHDDPDAAIDAPDPVPPDAPPTDLAEICGGKAPTNLAEWEACYRKRECERRVHCITANNYRDVQDCVDTWDELDSGVRGVAQRDRERSVAMHRATINATAFAQCLALINTSRCIDPTWDAACALRFSGTIADAGDCYADTDCASPGATCASSCADACCVGTCQPKLKQGVACQDFTACQPGLQCNGTTCITGDLGTTCSDVLQCDFDFWCDTTARRCKAKLAPGASCTDILQCPGDYTCVGLSISSSRPGKCMRNSQPGDMCDDLCHGNLVCDSAGFCRALPVLGQGCTPLVPCGGTDAICDRGQCVMRGDVGVTCGNQTCLPGLFCTGELADPTPSCAARGATGAPCRDPGHCESYLCSGDRTHEGVCLAWNASCPS